MSLIPDITELLARARADLRMGVPIVLVDDNGGSVLAISAETITPQRLADLRSLGGAPVVAITGRIQKPIAAVDVARIRPKLTLSELRQPFVKRIEKAIYTEPF